MPNVTMHSKAAMQTMNSSHLISPITTPKSPLSSTYFHCPPTTKLRRILTPMAIASPPRPRITQITPNTPTNKTDIFKELEPWAVDSILPLLKPVDTIWQPNDYLPDPSKSSDDFTDEVRALRERTAELPDDYFVALVGDMITEEAVPTYMNMVNTFTEVRDQTGASPCPWAVWTRAWTAEENRHGDLLRTYLYLSGRVDMTKIERTIQYLIGAGMDGGMENSAYLGFVYTSFQERATFVSHGNTARLAKDGGDPVLAKICGTIASDEKRHENAYSRIVDKLLDIDTSDAMVAIADMMKKKITMPAHLMYDGEDPCIFEHFSAVAQRLGVYTTGDYADIVEVLVDRWKLEKREGMNGEGRRAQDYVCGLAPRFRKLQERADERARKLEPRSVKFSWIFNKEVRVTP